MNRLPIRGAALALVLLALASCGTGNRLDTDTDYGPLQSPYDVYAGRGAGIFLPTINRVDSGKIPLENGTLVAAGQLLIDPASGARVALPQNTIVRSTDKYYDDDLDGNLDFIILTIRPLSAHAAANVTAYLDSTQQDAVDPAKFIKVGGIALEPVGATFEPFVTVAMPVHPVAEPSDGMEYDLYRFNDGSVSGREVAEDIGTDTGWWEYVGTATVQEPPQAASSVRGASQTTQFYVSFDIAYNAADPTSSFGQYCIVDDSIPIAHNGGTGGDM